jgi:hypothetical protein
VRAQAASWQGAGGAVTALVIAGPKHQNFLWMTGSKRGDAEIAEDFAEKKWIFYHGTRVIFILNNTKPHKLSAFLCELRVSAFR